MQEGQRRQPVDQCILVFDACTSCRAYCARECGAGSCVWCRRLKEALRVTEQCLQTAQAVEGGAELAKYLDNAAALQRRMGRPQEAIAHASE